jgi:hypothetical protein
MEYALLVSMRWIRPFFCMYAESRILIDYAAKQRLGHRLGMLSIPKLPLPQADGNRLQD